MERRLKNHAKCWQNSQKSWQVLRIYEPSAHHIEIYIYIYMGNSIWGHIWGHHHLGSPIMWSHHLPICRTSETQGTQGSVPTQ
jgi:hypothetical protein